MRLLLCSLPVLLAVAAGGCGSDANPAEDLADPTVGAQALEEAERFLDTDRPQLAAQLLRQYQGGDLTPRARLLAARAEAGRGDWRRVRALLGGAPGLDTLGGGRARYLLARASDETGDLEAAGALYGEFVRTAGSAMAVERDAARLRHALVTARLDPEAGDRALAAVSAVPPDWRAVLEAEALARDGETARVDSLARGVTGGERGRRMWAARVEAARQSGDLDAAQRLADRARARAGSGASRAAFTLSAGTLAEQAGEAARARALYREAVGADPASPAARRAAARLRQGDPSPAEWLAIAQADRALGLNAEAADALRQWLDADVGTARQRADVRYQAADALYDAQRYDEAEATLQPILARADARELLAGVLGRAGRTGEAASVYLGLAASGSRPARFLYFAADVLDEGGDDAAAQPLYERIEREHAGTRWARLGMLRRAGAAFRTGDFARAARLWDRTRAARPGGPDALRARYWAGRAFARAGDSTAAAERFRGVLRQERDGYYALLASQALGQPFWPVPMAASPPRDAGAAARAADALYAVDVLREAGFPGAAEAEVDRAIATASGGQAVRYALAEALVERGYGRRAIQIGQGLGGGTNARRLRILYPFPFRRMVTAEAQTNGIDPFAAAALIRQESLFSARATSHVGARGLMQLMPTTARALAGEVGMEDWDPDLLYLPEVNVRLGTRYVGQQARAYDGALPAVFGAYNAGPHQVDRWRSFPEFGRDALFTERIPFRETRDYVKVLTRNRAIYRGLYGTD